MRVLITGPALSDPGGISNYFCGVLPHLRSRVEQVEYFELGSTRSASPWHVVSDQLRFAAAIENFRPDVVHVNPTLSWKGYLRDGLQVRIAAMKQLPVFVFFRGWNQPFARRLDGWPGRYFQATFRHATAFAVLARNFESQLRHWNLQQPVHVGTTAVADQDFRGLDFESVERERESDFGRILYLSRLEPEKGFLETIEAVRRIAASGRKVSLTVAGNGPGELELRKRLAEVGLSESINFVGYVRGHEKLSLLKSHSIFCLPTRYEEGLPNALLEAMAAGMAIVTSPTAGISDIFLDGDMGVSVPARNIEAIQQAIETLLDDKQRLRRIGRHNRRHAMERFLSSHAAQWLLERYAECIAIKRAAPIHTDATA